MMQRPLLAILLLSISCNSFPDSVLVYEVIKPDHREPVRTSFSIHGRWIRVESEPVTQDRYYLFDAGYMIMHVIDHGRQSYASFGIAPPRKGYDVAKRYPDKTLPAVAEDAYDSNLSATRNIATTVKKPSRLIPGLHMDKVAGFSCQPMNEVAGQRQVSQHCMTDAATLGITTQEVKSMARLFDFTKDIMSLDWGAKHSEERLLSIRSVAADDGSEFRLHTLSTPPLPRDRFQIPRDYRKVAPAVLMVDIGEQKPNSPNSDCQTEQSC